MTSYAGERSIGEMVAATTRQTIRAPYISIKHEVFGHPAPLTSHYKDGKAGADPRSHYSEKYHR